MISLVAAGYRYPNGVTVGPVDVRVGRGELVLLVGSSGSGKSTIARLIAGITGVHGQGERFGEVRIGGDDPAVLVSKVRSSRVSFVAQEIDDQFLTETVGEELSFAAQHLEASEAASRCAAWLARCAVADGACAIDTLSTGQRQRLAIAAGLVGGAGAIVLDEPLAHLDPAAAERAGRELRSVADSGVAVVVVEHRLAPFWERCDRVIVVDGGRVVRAGSPAEVRSTLVGLGLDVPGESRPRFNPGAGPGDVVVRMGPTRWARSDAFLLEAPFLELRTGERVALVGANGAGKSSLLEALAGRAGAAAWWCSGRVVDVPQDPDLSLFCASVREELAFGAAAEIESLARAFSVAHQLDAHPAALSRGQRLRVAIAAAMAVRPTVLVLDEPTAGQDPAHVDAAMRAVAEVAAPGVLVFATHDTALAERFATRVLVIADGRVVADGPPELARSPQGQRERPGNAAVAPQVSTLDPRSGLIAMVSAGVLAVAFDGLAPLGILAVLSVFAAALGARRQNIGRAAAVVTALLWANLFAQGLFYADFPRTEAWSWGPVTVWREGLRHGGVQTLRFVIVAAVGSTVVRRVPAYRWGAAAAVIGIPRGVSFLAASAGRFVPVFLREWSIVRHARRRRLPLHPQWFDRTVELFAPWRAVIVRAVRRARVFAEALDVRGFDPLVAPVRPPEPWPVTQKYLSWLVVLGVFAVVVARLVFAAYAAGIAWHPRWAGFYAWWRAFG